MALRQFVTFVLVASALGCGGASVVFPDEGDAAPSSECPAKKHDECSVPNAEMCGGTLACCEWPSGEKTWEAPGKCPSAPASSTDTGTAVETATPDTTPASTDTGTIVVDSGTATDTATDTAKTDTSPATDSGSVDTGTASDSGSSDTSSDTGSSDTGTVVVDSGTTDTATVADSAPVPTTGTMVVHVRISRWGSHNVALYSVGSPKGGPSWTGSPLVSAMGKGVDATFSIDPDQDFVFNGKIDGAWAFANYLTGEVKIAAWATFNGKPVGRVKSKKNSTGDGYDLVFTSKAAVTSLTDMDGDGFDSTVDCNDNPDKDGNAFYPGQVEVAEDAFDFNCDKFNDPPRYVIQMKGVSSGYIPSLTDAMKWPAFTSMIWDAASTSYRSDKYEPETLPREFYISWGTGSWILYDSGISFTSGYCTPFADVTVFKDLDGTLVPTSLKISSGSGTCHRFVDLP